MADSEQTITISSNRFYLDELLEAGVAANVLGSLDMTFYRFGIMDEWTYNRIYDRYILGIPYAGTLTQMMKDEYRRRFGGRLSDYYAASINCRAQAVFSSQKELFKQYEKDFADRQKRRENKISELEAQLAEKRAVKKLLITRSKALKRGFSFNDGLFAEYRITVHDDGVLFRGKRNKMAKLSLYDYECMLDGQIRRLKTRIALIREKIRRAEATHLKQPRRATFGTRKQYRLKDTTDMTKRQLEQWHAERDGRRFHIIHFSGRHTSKYGNFQCRYAPNVKNPEEGGTAEITLMDGRVLRLKGVGFPYRGDELAAFRSDPKHPALGCSLERRVDGEGRPYIILKASFKVSNERCNYDTCEGLIAADLNTDHIAWSELNGDGCRIGGGTIRFDLNGLGSGKRRSVLGHAVSELMDICVDRKKPLGMEDLSIPERGVEYADKRVNRKLSEFASAAMTGLIEGQALRRSVGVIKVSPSYTSMLGKVKYMKPLGISIHCAASYVIGRRAMGFGERLPACLKDKYYTKARDGTIKNADSMPLGYRKPFAAYAYIYRHIKKAPVGAWYNDMNFDTWKQFDAMEF